MARAGAAKRIRAAKRKKAQAQKGAKGSASRWSAQVTRNSNAMDLENKVFAKESPAAIARSLKSSAEHSRRRKSAPFRSAMSMLTFYINRAGKNLPKARLGKLERAKGELRKAFGKD
jgi:hypothetical protein